LSGPALVSGRTEAGAKGELRNPEPESKTLGRLDEGRFGKVPIGAARRESLSSPLSEFGTSVRVDGNRSPSFLILAL